MRVPTLHRIIEAVLPRRLSPAFLGRKRARHSRLQASMPDEKELVGTSADTVWRSEPPCCFLKIRSLERRSGNSWQPRQTMGAAKTSLSSCKTPRRLPSARSPIFSNPLVPKSNGAAARARGRGTECGGRNHFHGSVHTCRDESLTTESVEVRATSLWEAKS